MDLGRDLAVKLLLEAHQEKPDLVRRFVEEAQIGGQLQHPGIVPVYELGAFADHRPYFTMKLVKGRTLAELLRDRTEPSEDQARFLSIFAQTCHTIAYAHARGVIHRDLKPSNIMVGSFGEVQVMDWGLAKVLPRGGAADDAEAGKIEINGTVIATARSDSDENASLAGSVLGTPAYMAPEQARGEIELVDERADVFGLGAILCEILTGHPAFTGRSSGETMRKAGRAELAEAFGRLDGCGAERELISLARDCLAAEREDRPRRAGIVAERITCYLAGVQERLRQSELARVEERARRRLTQGAAASLVAILVLGGCGWAYVRQARETRRAEVERSATEALDKAARLWGQARAAGAALPAGLSEAINAAELAEGLLGRGDAGEAVKARSRSMREGMEQDRLAAEAKAEELRRDRALLSRLESIRGTFGDDLDRKRTDRDYAAAFRDFGVDIDRLDPAEAGRRLGSRSEPVELASYIDDWVIVRRGARQARGDWRRLLDVARATDPDPWRTGLRAKIGDDGALAAAALRGLADDEQGMASQPVASLMLLAIELRMGLGDRARAESVLRRAWRRRPDDFWLNHELSHLYYSGSATNRLAEVTRYLSAALAIRPGSAVTHDNLGVLLGNQDKFDAAIAEHREAIRLKPGNIAFHTNLGAQLKAQGKLDLAVAECREAVRLDPDSAWAHTCLGSVLEKQGKLDLAVAEHREALRLDHDSVDAHANLGETLSAQRKFDLAIAECREAIRLNPESSKAHTSLGLVFGAQDRLNDAIAEFRVAVRLKPDYAQGHFNLAAELFNLGQFDEAMAECRQALRLNPDSPHAHGILGAALFNRGWPEEAIAEYRIAMRLKTDWAETLNNFAYALMELGSRDEALAYSREAVRLTPDRVVNRHTLGEVYTARGQFDEALAALREVDRAKPPTYRYAAGLARQIRQVERQQSLARKVPAVLDGPDSPINAEERLEFADVCRLIGRPAAATRLFALAFQSEPRLADDMPARNRFNAARAAVLAGAGNGDEKPALDQAARARSRKQAIEWLKADLAFFDKVVEAGKSGPISHVGRTLRLWKADFDLAPIRDDAALRSLPDDEQMACRALWAEVEKVLKATSPRL